MKIKVFRKQVRKELNNKYGEGFGILQKAVRQRSWYVPKLLWILLYLPIVKVKYLRLFYKYL